MRLKGITNDGICRLARVVGQQESDYGDGEYIKKVKDVLELDAEWTPEGWVIEGDLNLYYLGLTRLPKIKSVGGDFDCSANRLTSLEGAPQEVGGDFNCYGNPGNFTEEDVRAICDVKGEIYNEVYNDEVSNEEFKDEDNHYVHDVAEKFIEYCESSVNKGNIKSKVKKVINKFAGDDLNDIIEGITEELGYMSEESRDFVEAVINEVYEIIG